jgi:leucyl-tRNA synthetase
MQRNWIGRSEGASITFACDGVDATIEVFTTRPDTLIGATFLVVAPEYPELDLLVGGTGQESAVHEYVNEVRRAGNAERGVADKAKTGVFTGRYAVHPLTGERVPILVADYVFMEYGTGAIMAVPAHDERDFDFARVMSLPVRQVVAAVDDDGDDDGDAEMTLPSAGRGVAVNCGPDYDGRPSDEVGRLIVAALERVGAGKAATSYKLRDWLLSRQRYWGCPIPIVYCDSCGMVPVPEEQLPVPLPDVEDYAPKGKSPLAAATDWVNTPCPKCGGPGRRETDTMDTFVDSSWYYIRYCDPTNDTAPWGRDAITRWMPINQYIGGIEHAILHLLYSRFLCKALSDLDLLSVQEPFHKLFTQGMITKDGAKMSKSKGNVVSPRGIVARYGADTARSYVLFMGPPEVGADWSDDGVEGVYRFLKRLWRLSASVVESGEAVIGGPADAERDVALRRDTHEAIVKVTEDMSGRFAFNTAIAALMKLYNSCSKASQEGVSREVLTEALSTLASLLFPFAPHVASEVYYQLAGVYVWEQPWPVADRELLRSDVIELVLQVNAKNRATLRVPADATVDAIRELALAHDEVLRATAEGSSVKRAVVVPGRLVNVVVG